MKGSEIRLVKLRNPWGYGEWEGTYVQCYYSIQFFVFLSIDSIIYLIVYLIIYFSWFCHLREKISIMTTLQVILNDVFFFVFIFDCICLFSFYFLLFCFLIILFSFHFHFLFILFSFHFLLFCFVLFCFLFFCSIFILFSSYRSFLWQVWWERII